MPQIKSAKKRVRVTARQTEQNRLHRTRSRSAVKKVRTLLTEEKVGEAAKTFTVVQKYLDKAVKTNAVHPNTADRTKARLAMALKAAGNKGPLPKSVVVEPKKVTRKKPSRPKSATAKKAAPKKPAKKAPAKKTGSKS